MYRLLKQDWTFATFKYTRYATEVTLQQASRPSGTREESNSYFSGKQKLNGHEVEASVLHNGISIGSSNYFSGSISDIDIFNRMAESHSKSLREFEKERNIIGIGELIDRYPKYWAILMHKGYQGAGEFMRVVHPKKKEPNTLLVLDEEAYNTKVSSDRGIVENYFGRLCTLWTIYAAKYRWVESKYDIIFRMCMALTNQHILWSRLREADSDKYQSTKTRQCSIGGSI